MGLVQWYSDAATSPWMRQLVILGAALALAVLIRLVFKRVIGLFTGRTKTDVDDRIADELRWTAIWTVILVGVMLAHLEFEAPSIVDRIVLGTLQTVIGLLWAVALLRVGRIVLEVVRKLGEGGV